MDSIVNQTQLSAMAQDHRRWRKLVARGLLYIQIMMYVDAAVHLL